jgi:hypothetical protein
MEKRRPQWNGTGRNVLNNSRDNLPIILRDRAGRSSGAWGGLRIGRILAAADSLVAAAIGLFDRANLYREKCGLRQQERQREQRRQNVPGKFHSSRRFI